MLSSAIKLLNVPFEDCCCLYYCSVPWCVYGLWIFIIPHSDKYCRIFGPSILCYETACSSSTTAGFFDWVRRNRCPTLVLLFYLVIILTYIVPLHIFLIDFIYIIFWNFNLQTRKNQFFLNSRDPRNAKLKDSVSLRFGLAISGLASATVWINNSIFNFN